MTYRTRRTTFMQQLTAIARRAHHWAIATHPRAPQHQAVTHHMGRAY